MAELFPILLERESGPRGSTDQQLRKMGVAVAIVGLPWEMIRPHETQAQRNHGQSLERLAARGGLGACEALAVIEDRSYRQMGEAAAHTRLRRLLTEFYEK